MHKKYLALIGMALAMALIVSACGGQSPPRATEVPVEAPVDSPAENTPQVQPEPEIPAYPSPVEPQPVEGSGFSSPYPLPGTGAMADSSAVDGLLATLQGAGLETQIIGDVTQAFFTVPGKRMLLNEEEIQVYAYSAPETAESEAAAVSADGNSVGTTVVDWISTPHFYRSGNLIVIYVGENQTVLQVLQSVLGNPFAGG